MILQIRGERDKKTKGRSKKKGGGRLAIPWVTLLCFSRQKGNERGNPKSRRRGMVFTECACRHKVGTSPVGAPGNGGEGEKRGFLSRRPWSPGARLGLCISRNPFEKIGKNEKRNGSLTVRRLPT